MSGTRDVRIAAPIAWLLLGSSAALAQDATIDLARLSAASQLVAQTRVSKVEYRMSQGGAGTQAIPYTLVTYNVVEPLSGSSGQVSFTLRFIGGPDGQGRFLQASNVPVFQVGDQDILFVQGDGSAGCPLVDCIEGRFRIHDGVVYTGQGSPVRSVVDAKASASGPTPAAFETVRYPAPKFDELIKNPQALAALSARGLSIEEARRRYEADAPPSVEIRAVTSSDPSGDRAAVGERAASDGARQPAARPLPLDSFADAVRATSAVSGRSGATFRSNVAAGQIATPTPQPAPPGPMPATRSSAPPRSPADIAEERGLPADDPTIFRNKAQ